MFKLGIKLSFLTSTVENFAFFEGELKYFTSTVRILLSLDGISLVTLQYL